MGGLQLTHRLSAAGTMLALALAGAACGSEAGPALTTTSLAATTTIASTTTIPSSTTAAAPTTTVRRARALVVDGPGTYDAELVSGGMVRRFRLVIPRLVPDPAPLLLVFHGFTRSPEEIEATTRFSALAEEEGFVVLYPAGTGFPTRWLASPWQGDQDVVLTRDLVALVSTAVSIDARRVFAAGFSNGGGMVARLACDAADLVAAVGPVAAAYPMGPCDPSRPVPIAAVHGTADPIVPYWGLGEALPAVEAVLASWVEGNGCETSPITQEVAPGVTRLAWGGCAAGADLILYRVAEGRHGWPGAGDESVWGRTTDEVDASALLWEFFATHPMP